MRYAAVQHGRPAWLPRYIGISNFIGIWYQFIEYIWMENYFLRVPHTHHLITLSSCCHILILHPSHTNATRCNIRYNTSLGEHIARKIIFHCSPEDLCYHPWSHHFSHPASTGTQKYRLGPCSGTTWEHLLLYQSYKEESKSIWIEL